MCLDAESGKLTEKIAILPHSGRGSVSCAANKGIRQWWLSHRANVCFQLSRITYSVSVCVCVCVCVRWKTIAEIMSKISDDLWTMKNVMGEKRMELLNARFFTTMPSTQFASSTGLFSYFFMTCPGHTVPNINLLKSQWKKEFILPC